jgi:hypothetical protein
MRTVPSPRTFLTNSYADLVNPFDVATTCDGPQVPLWIYSLEPPVDVVDPTTLDDYAVVFYNFAGCFPAASPNDGRVESDYSTANPGDYLGAAEYCAFVCSNIVADCKSFRIDDFAQSLSAPPYCLLYGDLYNPDDSPLQCGDGNGHIIYSVLPSSSFDFTLVYTDTVNQGCEPQQIIDTRYQTELVMETTQDRAILVCIDFCQGNTRFESFLMVADPNCKSFEVRSLHAEGFNCIR